MTERPTLMFKYDPHLQIYFLWETLIFSFPMKTTKFIALQKTMRFHETSIRITNVNVLHGQMFSKYIQSKDISQLSPDPLNKKRKI